MNNKIKYISVFILAAVIISSVFVFIFRTKIIAHYIPTIEQIGEIHINVKNDTSYINSKLTVKNKSFFKIKIDTIKYKIALSNKTYLRSQRFIGIELPSYGMDTLDFPLKIPYVTILKELSAQRKKGDSTNYSINISLQYATVFGKGEIPVNRSAKIKIPQPPELEIVDIKSKKFRLKSIHAIAKIKVINYSAVTLLIKDMRYSMKILEQGNLEGNYNKSITIKPNGATFIDLPLEINVNNIGKTLFEILINKDNYDYTLTLNAFLESVDPVKESFHVDLSKTGKMELKK